MVVADTSIPSFRSLPSDAEVAPPGVLPAQPKDQVLELRIERRATRWSAGASTPPPQVSVPPDESVRADQEAPPPVPGKELGSRCQKRPIGRREARPRPASSEDLQLVAEHNGLELQLIEAAPDE